MTTYPLQFLCWTINIANTPHAATHACIHMQPIQFIHALNTPFSKHSISQALHFPSTPVPKHCISQALRRYVTSLSRHSQLVKAANPTEHFSPVQFKPLSKEILHKDRLGVIGRNLVISSSWSLGENKSYLHQSGLGLTHLFRDNTNFI